MGTFRADSGGDDIEAPNSSFLFSNARFLALMESTFGLVNEWDLVRGDITLSPPPTFSFLRNTNELDRAGFLGDSTSPVFAIADRSPAIGTNKGRRSRLRLRAFRSRERLLLRLLSFVRERLRLLRSPCLLPFFLSSVTGDTDRLRDCFSIVLVFFRSSRRREGEDDLLLSGFMIFPLPKLMGALFFLVGFVDFGLSRVADLDLLNPPRLGDADLLLVAFADFSFFFVRSFSFSSIRNMTRCKFPELADF